ncbi:hypothetical protein CN354_07755 [Bacillus cereus]|nr:hypothetical protein CN354_07755 [Bacillus cereus]
MVRKRGLMRRILFGVGMLLFSLGLMLQGFYKDMNVFEYTNKFIGASVFVFGILCLIASNFFRKPKAGNH